MKTKTKIISLVLVLLMLVPVVTGCSEAGRDILTSFIQDWVKTKFGIDLSDNSTWGKAKAGWGLMKLFTEDSTGNPDSDAALGTVKMLKNFKDAEQDMAVGRSSNNATAEDLAIALRPSDWSYRVSRSTLALKQNDVVKGQTEWKKGEDLAYSDQNPVGYQRFYSQSINELEAWKNTGQLDKANWEQQAFAYGTLVSDYVERYKLTKDPKDKQMALYYNEQWTYVTKEGKPPELDFGD
ncbi:MAG: hypothetical protein ABR886_09635 [Dehalococcoidales bacterium]|jgi:hypothetical protein